MKNNETGEAGYILASATVSMLMLGAIVTALSLVAVSELRRVSAAESRAEEEALLHAAIAFTAAELALDPANRSVAFDDGHDVLNIAAREINVSLRWESAKMDLNAASMPNIEAEAGRVGLPEGDVALLVSTLDNLRADALEVRLLDDILVNGFEMPGCVRSNFTVFGGRRRATPGIDLAGTFDRPTPGTRIEVTARLTGGMRTSRVVLLMTGDPVDPARIQDWRWSDEGTENVCSQ